MCVYSRVISDDSGPAGLHVNSPIIWLVVSRTGAHRGVRGGFEKRVFVMS